MARIASDVAVSNETELRLTGVRLFLARIGCLTISVFSLVLFVPGLQLTYQQFQSTCATAVRADSTIASAAPAITT